MRALLRPAQKRQSPDRQPLGYQNVAIVEKNGVMRRDEFAWRELLSCLAASRSHIAVFGFAISECHYHLVLTINDTYLTIQIRAYHPLALSVEVARHSHVLLVFNCF